MSFNCYKCNTVLISNNSDSIKIGFRDECLSCKNDLHCCKNCSFYDVQAYNQCRESQAERVVDKEKRNLCEYFTINFAGANKSNIKPAEQKTDALKKLDDLFK